MEYRQEGYPTLSPYLIVRDSAESLKFYQDAFGFIVDTEETKADENGNIEHAKMRFDDAVVMFSPEGLWGSPHKAPATLNQISPLTLYIYCPDVDALYKKAVTAGARSIVEPQDSFWGDRFCNVIDINGYQWCFATNNAK